MDVYFRANFQVSSILLTSFRQRWGGGGGVILTPPILKRTPEKSTQIRVNAMPDKGLVEKSKEAKGGKKSKQRFT